MKAGAGDRRARVARAGARARPRSPRPRPAPGRRGSTPTACENLEAKALGLGPGGGRRAAPRPPRSTPRRPPPGRRWRRSGRARSGPERAAARASAIRTPLAGLRALPATPSRARPSSAEHVIAVVGDLERAYFLGRLFEKDLARGEGRGAAPRCGSTPIPSEVFEGTVETIGQQIDPAARTVTARIAGRNHGDLLKVGLFGTARVVDRRRRARSASASSCRCARSPRSPTSDVVFVRQPDGDFELHEVTLGRLGRRARSRS